MPVSAVQYLLGSTMRLAAGIGVLAPNTWHPHGEYLLGTQQSDGGFAGRQGPSDLYYTSFALRGLSILGELRDAVAERAAAFLASAKDDCATTVDLLSLVQSVATLESSSGITVFAGERDEWRSGVGKRFSSLRRNDGGYAKSSQGAASSTYHTFLIVVSQQLLGIPTPDTTAIANFIRSQQAATGGFREIRVTKRASTNPTAAAASLLRVLGALDAETRDRTVDFLAQMQSADGGFLANSRIPLSDLLSTFTSLMTLTDLDAMEKIDRAAALRFVKSLGDVDGGFRAATWDTERDVEYTFYGLGCLALLQQE
jgi:geranylgeranyl transferase type-2 subunit beta